MTLTFDPMTLNTKSVHLPIMVINHIKFGEDPSTHFRDIMPTGFSYMTFDPMTFNYLIKLFTDHAN